MKGPYFTIEQLMEEAEAKAGASNWGGDEFREPLRIFIDALNRETELTAEGLRRTRRHIVKMLAARLGLFRCYDEYPDIEREEIVAPVFVTGQVRTGTSFANALLASDSRHLPPLQWQTFYPYPPCNLPGIDHRPQIEQGERDLREEGWQDPEIRKRHNFANCEPAEDTHIQDLSFISLSFPFFWHVPSYGDYLVSADYSHPYKMIKLFAKMMQYGDRRKRLVLKCPLHLQQLDHLFAEFPDARVVVTHRDPVKSVGSIFGLLRAHRMQFGNSQVTPDRSAMRDIIDGGAFGLSKLIEWRKGGERDARFVDIIYRDLEADPHGTMEAVYAKLGIAFTERASREIARYIAENRKGKFGAHTYSVKDHGLNEAEIREKFRFYTDGYDVPLGV